jgi:hypothetical protein
VPALDIFSQFVVDRQSGGWSIIRKGHVRMEFLKARMTAWSPIRFDCRLRVNSGRNLCRRSRSIGRSVGASAERAAAKVGSVRATRPFEFVAEQGYGSRRSCGRDLGEDDRVSSAKASAIAWTT